MKNVKPIGAASAAYQNLTEAEFTKRIDDIVDINIWDSLPDRGRDRMVIDVLRDAQLSAALEDYSQIMCDINWHDLYQNMSLSLHYEERVKDPSKAVPRDAAIRGILENQIRIAQEVIDSFRMKLLEHIEESIGRYDAARASDEDYNDE